MTTIPEQKTKESVPEFKFHHLHFYCDDLKTTEEYKHMEEKLNKFGELFTYTHDGKNDLEHGRKIWNEVTGTSVDPSAYIPQGQDIVTQLLHGVGCRVTGEHVGDAATARSLCVRFNDNRGVQFIVSSKNKLASDVVAKKQKMSVTYDHFLQSHIDEFYTEHGNKQGIACLGFEVGRGGLDIIYSRYQKKHPKLLASGKILEYAEGFRILEVFAYYKGAKLVTEADHGTIIRFVEVDQASNEKGVILPGMNVLSAEFDNACSPAYCDHWVSNVISREGFLDTLNDTLGFTPKVDFNAGVVAAGEAQIESTVTGNSTMFETVQTAEALVDQSQVYLPINNALSEVGHVHWFLEELGQGVQHVASRVKNLPAFIQQSNDYREMTGEGFTFLNIPRSYYGRLTVDDMVKYTNASKDLCENIFKTLISENLMDVTGVVKLNITNDEITDAISSISNDMNEKFIFVIKRSRYVNLYKLLRDHLSEESYLRIVRNKILVDIQGGDLLYQIFTSNVLQRKAGEEAPFLEFIQRVCSEKKCDDGSCKPIKPGCGGFGIRNFLTLFLSIEVSKAMRTVKDAKANGDTIAEQKANKQVAVFTAQLDEANPILTIISDAMTLEGELLDAAAKIVDEDNDEKKELIAKAMEQRKIKNNGQELLKATSLKYAKLMKELRES
eukprot:g8706.t1